MANLLKITILSTLAYNAMWISNGFDHIAVAYTGIRLLIYLVKCVRRFHVIP